MAPQLINQNGINTILAVCAVLAALSALSVAFVLWRGTVLAGLQTKCKGLGRSLAFHSPDDTPRSFQQYGYQRNLLGYLLLRVWPLLFVVGYIYVMVFCFLSYAPGWPLPYHNELGLPPLPTYFLEAYGGWNGFMAPWLVIFTLVHVLGMLLIIFWSAVEARFMVPVASLDEATHIMIEEDVPWVTDDDLEDPDEGQNVLKMIGLLREKAVRLKRRYKRAKCRTIVPVQHIEHHAEGRKWMVKTIEYTCVRYVYQQSDDSFSPVGIVDYKPMEIHETLRRGGMTEQEAAESIANTGPNEIVVYVPGIAESLVTEFSDFTGIFASIGTWSYYVFSSWNLGLFWVILTWGSSIYRALGIVRPNRKKTAELAQLQGSCEVLRGGKWRSVDVAEIALGDILKIAGGGAKLPCDGVVLQGSLVVNESMLTGEPMPIQKMPVEHSQNAAVSKKNIAYAGTLCLQSNNTSGGDALMIASAVGALTTRGQLVRMVLFPTTVRFRYNDQMPMVYGLMFIYMLFLCTIYLLFMDLGSWIALYLLLLNTVAMCLSPMLPVSLVAGQTVSAARLNSGLEIGCLQPARIPIAGKISTMVFDKTGTITKDGMDFEAVVSVENGAFGQQISFDTENQSSAANVRTANSSVPPLLRNALASCHTVTMLHGMDPPYVGNQVEISMVMTVGWDIQEDKVVSPDGSQTLELVKKMEFDHHRMTSGIVVRDRQTNQLTVYVKGSYERVGEISQAVPADYRQRTEAFANDGYYVLGLAAKQLPAGMTAQQLMDTSRDSLEAGLQICGLLLFRNEMKPSSPGAIEALKRGGIRSVICTGDNELTGVSIGRKCGIVTARNVLIGDAPNGYMVWTDPANPARSVNPDSDTSYQLAVKQAGWRHLHKHPLEMESYWRRIVVFARMKPDDKINVVKYFQGRNLVTGMCGDGGNDCGGLRAAHAGLALSDAEASLVAPFASGRDGKSLMTVVDMIREGRACLATNLATFQYFMVYAFVLTAIRTILAIRNTASMGEYVWVTMDIAIGIVMVTWFATASKPKSKLAPYRPTATLLGWRTVSGIAVPVVSSIVAFLIALLLLWSKPWYVNLNPIKDIHLAPRYWMLRGDQYDAAVGVLMLLLTLGNTAYVNTYGGDFRQNIARNWKMQLMYALVLFALGWLNFAKPTQFSCVYRVNCDTEQSLAAKDLGVLAGFSAGGVGGCFLGPQVQLWQTEMEQYGWTGAAPAGPLGSCSPSGGEVPEPVKGECPYWLPDKEQNQCQPLMSLPRAGPGLDVPVLNTLTADDSPDISVNGCSGPNNCFGSAFKWEMATVMFLYCLVNHLFVKCVLQGAGVRALRDYQRRKDNGLDDSDDYDENSSSDSGGATSSEDEDASVRVLRK